ncbi:hypothetical protein ZWY2020_024488 [Hordeum vulgare]|nr:hypothetical protein ZWY2020_024488 [Hordeum vulgare]
MPGDRLSLADLLPTHLPLVLKICRIFQEIPGHAKWRYMGPPNLKEMDVMFENAHVTETASIPERYPESDDDAIAEVKESEDLGTPLKSFKKKGGQGKTLGKCKSKSHVEDEKDKNPFLRAYKQTLGKINSRVSEGSANHVPKVTAPTMGEVLNLMVECGAEEGLLCSTHDQDCDEARVS